MASQLEYLAYNLAKTFAAKFLAIQIDLPFVLNFKPLNMYAAIIGKKPSPP